MELLDHALNHLQPTEYATFLHPSFDPNSFAHSIVNNEPYPPPEATTSADAHGKPELNGGVGAVGGFMKGIARSGEDGGDVSAALARLNFGVEDLNRQLKAEVRDGSHLGKQAAIEDLN